MVTPSTSNMEATVNNKSKHRKKTIRTFNSGISGLSIIPLRLSVDAPASVFHSTAVPLHKPLHWAFNIATHSFCMCTRKGLNFTNVSWTITFRDKLFPRRTFPGQDANRIDVSQMYTCQESLDIFRMIIFSRIFTGQKQKHFCEQNNGIRNQQCTHISEACTALKSKAYWPKCQRISVKFETSVQHGE